MYTNVQKECVVKKKLTSVSLHTIEIIKWNLELISSIAMQGCLPLMFDRMIFFSHGQTHKMCSWQTILILLYPLMIKRLKPLDITSIKNLYFFNLR